MSNAAKSLLCCASDIVCCPHCTPCCRLLGGLLSTSAPQLLHWIRYLFQSTKEAGLDDLVRTSQGYIDVLT